MNKYKDTLFRCYFSQKKYLLALLNTLLKTNSTDENEIELNTLDGLFFSKEGKNDISCSFQNRYLVLIEHQSTMNENMPLRCLFYVAELYKNIISPFKNKIFHEKSIMIPRPEFFVLYNGITKVDDIVTMKLSDSFDVGENINLELIVKQININEGSNETEIENCKPLNDYCKFINRMKKNIYNGLTIDDSLKETSQFCLNNNVMTDFILDYRRELSGMYWFEYDAEADRIERERELAKERNEGIKQGKLSTIKNLLNVGTPIDFIVKATGWSEEQILKIAEQN